MLLPGRSNSTARCTENGGQLKSRSDLELRVGAVLGRLVVAPSQKRRRMTESIALHVVVLHFTHALDPQRLPRQIFSRTPSAVAARHPLALVHRLRPFSPWM